MNDIIFNWLKGFPGLELLQKQQADAVPGGCGLFFRGVKVTDRSYDLLGACRGKKTHSYRLCRYGEPEESAVFFLLLGAWVQANENTLGASVTAAQETNRQSLSASVTAALEKARCVRDSGGLALWEADLDITCREEL